MDSKTTIQHNKLLPLENSMLTYGIHNAETLERLINTVHQIHNITSSHERYAVGISVPYLMKCICPVLFLSRVMS